MDEGKLSTWVQSATAVAVLIGLGLVVWELQQTRDLARAQIVHDGYSVLIDESHTILGESFATVYAKACLHPAELTDGEIVQVRKYHDSILYFIRRIREVRDAGDYAYSWEQIARGHLHLWLSSEIGRLHYRYRAEQIGLEPEIRRLAEDVLAGEQTAPCDDLANFIKDVRAFKTE